MKYNIKTDRYGTKYYRVKGRIHREDGPAVEFADGGKWWYKNGKIHREEGPAFERNGRKQWWLNNNFYGTNDDFTNESWQRFIKTLIFS